MKTQKLAYLFFSLCLILQPCDLHAQAGATAAGSMVIGGSTQVGVLAAVNGRVEISSGGQVGKVVSSGDPVFMGDVVRTDETSAIQLMMMDETVFTIGPSSAMKIDEFAYNKKTKEDKLVANVLEGTFRAITGKIGQKKPGSMKVKLPVGVMAVRGTMVFLLVDGQKSTCILGGPGKNHNTGHRTGSVEMENDVTGENGDTSTKSTLVTKPGSASTIEGNNAPPSPPFDFPPELYNQLEASFGGSQDSEDEDDDDSGDGSEGQKKTSKKKKGQKKQASTSDDGGSVTSTAGQDDAGGFDDLEGGEGLDAFGDFLDELISDEGSALGDENAFEIEDGITRIQDLASIDEGVFHFAELGIPIFHNEMKTMSDTYDFFLEIDFGDGRIGGGDSRIKGDTMLIDGGATFVFDIPDIFYDDLSGDASFLIENLSKSGCMSNCATAQISFDLINENGEVAAFQEHDIEVSDYLNTTTITGSGSGNSELLPGEAPEP